MSLKPDAGSVSVPDRLCGSGEFLDILDDVLTQSGSLGRQTALIVIDLSRIEMLVPRVGYRKISSVMEAVLGCLQAEKRPSDIVSRIGEYRFSLVIPELKFAEMVELAANKLVESLSGLRELTGTDVYIHPTASTALFPEDGQSAEQLLLAAEIALKRPGSPGSILSYASSPVCDKKLRSRLMETELEQAFRDSCFELYYQPKVALGRVGLYGAEALLRWNHPEHGRISPELFVPLIEKSPILVEVTLWTLNTALKQSMQMRQRSPGFKVAVNLTPELLNDPDLVELVAGALRTWDANPDGLIIEITETSMMSGSENTYENLRRFGEMGIGISIDDFGTGYSSYSYLQHLSVDELKIDRQFITDILENDTDAKLVKSMIDLASELGINVLAEGIESMAVMKCLVQMGCQYGQGYFFARPMSAVDMLAWIDAAGWEKFS